MTPLDGFTAHLTMGLCMICMGVLGYQGLSYMTAALFAGLGGLTVLFSIMARDFNWYDKIEKKMEEKVDKD